MPPAPKKFVSPLKPIRRSTSSSNKRALDHDDDSDYSQDVQTEVSRLANRKLIRSMSGGTKLKDVVACISYITDTMFDDIPERAGMNSQRIAEVLNFRKNLPPIVTFPHVQALSHSPTIAEREIAKLIQEGIVRKLVIPGRGLGNTYIGECLVLVTRWIDIVKNNSAVSQQLKDKYLRALADEPSSSTVKNAYFEPSEVSQLVQAGFLTSVSTRHTMHQLAADGRSSTHGTLSSLASAGFKAPTGSLAAVGGIGAVHDAGGSGPGFRQSDSASEQLNFSLPSVGLYLRILGAGRDHMVTLLSKTRYKEAPLDILKERWDGGVSSGDRTKRPRGLASAILPGRTKKWKQYNGIRFKWMLEECFGAGAIELFDTGTVGVAARVPGSQDH